MENPSEKLRALVEANVFDLDRVGLVMEAIRETEKIEDQLNKNRRTRAIRTFLSQDKGEKITVAISAMREKELIDFIFRYDTTEQDCSQAYEYLHYINPNKYKKLEV